MRVIDCFMNFKEFLKFKQITLRELKRIKRNKETLVLYWSKEWEVGKEIIIRS